MLGGNLGSLLYGDVSVMQLEANSALEANKGKHKIGKLQRDRMGNRSYSFSEKMVTPLPEPKLL